tara:strand:+ start:3210 stop:3527 length:318 start_codon:yes stop_codon:yes gene_type:complete
MTNELHALKEQIEQLNKIHQIEVLRILQKQDKITLNENKNGIFINLTNINEAIIVELNNYLEYVKQQENQLLEIEEEKNKLSNTYFLSNNGVKDNKENSTMYVSS